MGETDGKNYNGKFTIYRVYTPNINNFDFKAAKLGQTIKKYFTSTTLLNSTELRLNLRVFLMNTIPSLCLCNLKINSFDIVD